MSWFGSLFSKATPAPAPARPANEQAAINAAKAWDPKANNEKAALNAAKGWNATVDPETKAKMNAAKASFTQGGGRRKTKGKGRSRKTKSKGKKRSTRK